MYRASTHLCIYKYSQTNSLLWKYKFLFMWNVLRFYILTIGEGELYYQFEMGIQQGN